MHASWSLLVVADSNEPVLVCTQFSKVCIKLRCGLYKAPKICGAGVSQKMWAPELYKAPKICGAGVKSKNVGP